MKERKQEEKEEGRNERRQEGDGGVNRWRKKKVGRGKEMRKGRNGYRGRR